MRSHSSTVWLRIAHDVRVVNPSVAHLRERAERRLAHLRRWRGLSRRDRDRQRHPAAALPWVGGVCFAPRDQLRRIAAMITLAPSMRVRGFAGQRPVAHSGSSLRAGASVALDPLWDPTVGSLDPFASVLDPNMSLTACEMALAAASERGRGDVGVGPSGHTARPPTGRRWCVRGPAVRDGRAGRQWWLGEWQYTEPDRGLGSAQDAVATVSGREP